MLHQSSNNLLHCTRLRQPVYCPCPARFLFALEHYFLGTIAVNLMNPKIALPRSYPIYDMIKKYDTLSSVDDKDDNV